MKYLMKMATVAVSLSLLAGAAAKADVLLKYAFSPGTYFNFSGGAANAVTGSFTYDVTTKAVTNVNYHRGGDHFTTGALYSFIDTAQIYFGNVNSSDYDVYQLKSSLALGGVDKIASGTHPGIYISAGGSLVGRAVPEPASWALMLVGFGLVGAATRSGKLRASIRHA